jgi:competence protein ComEC
VLAVAVTGLVWVDPFLVDAVAFQLSVAASAGILVLGPPLARRLPGPDLVVQPLATTLSAQAAVAPVLTTHFGPVSLVAVPANLAGGWAAAGVMTWGMSFGIVAGLLPPSAAAVVQLPARLLLWWLETVAAIGASVPGARPSPVVLAALAGLGLVGRGLRRRGITVAAAALAVAVLLVSVPRAPVRPGACGTGMTWFPGGGSRPGRSVLVVGREAGTASVGDCLQAGVRRPDLVVVERGDREASRLVAALREVMAVTEVWAPPQHLVVGARRRLTPVTVATAREVLSIGPGADGRDLVVDVVVEPGGPLSPEVRSDGGPRP